jgi:hypothetical protein
LATVDRFIVEYRPGNETKWRQLTEQQAIAGKAQSHSAKAPELRDAFSVRVLFVDGQSKRVVAATGEQIVRHRAAGNSCERVAPGQPVVEQRTPETLEFAWERSECEGHVQGWEYSVSGIALHWGHFIASCRFGQPTMANRRSRRNSLSVPE